MLSLDQSLKDFFNKGDFGYANDYCKLTKAGKSSRKLVETLINIYCCINDLYNADHSKIYCDNYLYKIFVQDVVNVTEVPALLECHYIKSFPSDNLYQLFHEFEEQFITEYVKQHIPIGSSTLTAVEL